MKIVLLEPDKVLADTYRQVLMHDGHKVVMCATAQAAIFAADELQPDLIIMEMQLTGHSGIEFLYEFRSYDDWTSVPVVVLSNVPAGEFSDCWNVLKEQLGVEHYHYKPLTTLRTLLKTVNAIALRPESA